MRTIHESHEASLKKFGVASCVLVDRLLALNLLCVGLSPAFSLVFFGV